MALTVTESSAVNTLLRHLTGLPRSGAAPTDRDVHDAAVTLARSASRRLGAGVRPADLQTPWPAHTLYSVTRAEAERVAGRTLTDGEAARISRALQHSSIPDATATVIASIVVPD